MKYKVQELDNKINVLLDGQLNFSCNDDFRTLLSTIGQSKLRQAVFNMSNLTGIDSVGLGLLYIAQEDLSALGIKLSLSSPRGSVTRLLELTDAGKMFEISDWG